MNHQASLSQWDGRSESAETNADPFDFDDYGPTADYPLPPEEETRDPDRSALLARGVDVDGWDELEFGGTGGFHLDDYDRDQHRDAERHAEVMEQTETDDETDTETMSESNTDIDDRHRNPSSIHTDYSELEEIPENVPICAEKARIELANRLLRAAVGEVGHHDPTRTAIIDYHRDDDRDYTEDRSAFEKAAYSLTPSEVNRGRLAGGDYISPGDQSEAVIDWMKNDYREVFLDTREEYNHYLREQCEAALEEQRANAEAEAFIDDPSAEVAGWVRIETDHEDVLAAYRGIRVDTPSVLVIGRDDEGRPDAPIFTYDDWRESDGFADYRPRGDLRPNTWGTVAPETMAEAVRGAVDTMERNEQETEPPAIDDDGDDGPEAVTDGGRDLEEEISDRIKSSEVSGGFDLTHFSKPERFESIINALGLEYRGRRDGGQFVWTADGVVLTTGNHPITGEFRDAEARESEPGYASYILIAGDDAPALELYESIRETATSIKGETPLTDSEGRRPVAEDQVRLVSFEEEKPEPVADGGTATADPTQPPSPGLPENWTATAPETTDAGSRFFFLKGFFDKPHGHTVEKTIIIYRPADGGMGDWLAKSGKGYGRGDVITFGEGKPDEATRAALQAAHDANADWPDKDGYGLGEPPEIVSPPDVETLTDGGQPVEVEEDQDDDGDELPGDYDPEAETVGEGWEGEYIFTSWGYGQTNVELAKIVDVSDSGKTVVARMATKETVGHGKTSQSVAPGGEVYGDRFRLHVRGHADDKPWFRGSYPYLRGGDMDDGTRLDSFMWWEPDRESTHETAPGYGH